MSQPKEASELEVAQIFCNWYSREYSVPCSVICKLPEPAPDVLIRVGNTNVALELARYREQGIHNQLYQLNSDFMSALSARFNKFGRNRLPRCTPRLDYRQRQGKPGYYEIPHPNRWREFGDELIALLKSQRKPRESSQVMQLLFIHRMDLGESKFINRQYQYLANESHPILSEYCKGVNLLWHPDLGIQPPRSSMNSRFTHIDWQEIERMIRQKLSKVTAYRSAVPDTPVWLLYYADGFTPTGRLPGKEHNVEVVSRLKALLAEQQSGFDIVWWADEYNAINGPTVFKVI